MKKLTWALLSLTLFLGMGTASAATLPTPAFNPATGAAVPPGTKVTIKLPASLDIAAYSSVGVMYVENNSDVVLEVATAEEWTDAVKEDMGSQEYTAEAGESKRVWKTAVVDPDEDEPTFGTWMSQVQVSEDATGSVTLRMRLVAVTATGIEYSDEFEAKYTIDRYAVVKPTAPSFTLSDDGKLSMENGYADRFHFIVYKVNGTDRDFVDGETVFAAAEAGSMSYYEEPIDVTDYTEEDVVKAVTLEYYGEEIIMSNIATFPAQTLPTPSFAITGSVTEVVQGDALDITLPADLDWDEYMGQAIIIYVENDKTTELEYDGSWGALLSLVKGGGGDVRPMAKAVGEPAFKAAYYDADEGKWSPAVSISSVGLVNVRARMATGSDYQEKPLFSNEFSATYMVTPRPAPDAPTFLIDGEALEGTSVMLDENQTAEVSWSGYPEESENYIVVYTTDGSESVFEAKSMDDAIMADAKKWSFKDEAIEVSAPATIKAAVAEIDASSGITWSEIVTVSFTVKALPETVMAPAFVPAAGEVEKGTAINWTWDEAYNEYDVKGVVYVANGKDEDLNIDAAEYYELLAAWEDEDENTVREDGVVYLYLGEEEAEVYPYEVEKNVTVKARMVVGLIKEMAEGEEGEAPEFELAFSPVVTAAYTVKGETPVVETVAAPTFSPVAGAVKRGTKVEI
ncbi:MAG: hypothetical protein K2O53_08700, partial [Bacteroidales bacterium]|nr:hypothetical protein [Bacteroidales bacterium]